MEGFEGHAGPEAPTDIDYLEEVVQRSKERRKSMVGTRRTSKAKAAEAVLIAYAPKMLREIRKLRARR